MVTQEDILIQLIEINKNILSELELLTYSVKAKALTRFQNEYLGTEQRQKMYKAINGESDSQAISNETNSPLRTVQAFIKELLENDLITFTKRGKALIPQKAISKISIYYANNDLKAAGDSSNG